MAAEQHTAEFMTDPAADMVRDDSHKKPGAIVAVVADGKIEYFTPREFQQFAKDAASGAKKIPEGAREVMLNGRGEVIGSDSTSNAKYETLAQQAKAVGEGVRAIWEKDKENTGAVIAILNEDGSIAASQSFKTEEEAATFIKSGKKLQKDGKDIEVGDKQSLVAVGLDKNGAMKAAIGGHKGADAYKEMAADIEAAEKEAAEKGKKFDWGQMMQKAMESGNMGMMILCAIVALVSSRQGEEPEVVQTPPELQAGQAAPRPLNIGLNVSGFSEGLAAAGVSMEAYDAAPGGQEKLTAAAGMSTEKMAKLVADKAGIPENQLTALTEAMKAGEQVSGDTKTVNVDIDQFVPPATPAQAASTGKGGGLNIG